MHHPVRPGVRGGKDQFKWEDVKGDKDRENYLGHSVMAPVGRWQKGKDLNWYAKEKSTIFSKTENDRLKNELKRIKEEEEERMNVALGLKPKSKKKEDIKLLQGSEVKELFKKTKKEENGTGNEREGDRIQGLGFNLTPKYSLDKHTPSKAEKSSKEKTKTDDLQLKVEGSVENERNEGDETEKRNHHTASPKPDLENTEKRKHRKRHVDENENGDGDEEKKKHKKSSHSHRRKHR